jgi:hypothetical protein
MPLRMSKTEREQFLREPRIGVVGIDESGRAPRVVPIWYHFDPAIGVSILSNESSRKSVLLREAGCFSLCVQDDSSLAYRHVSVQGPIIEIRPCELERDFRPLAHRYLGSERGDAFVEESGSDDRLIFTMCPEHWVTADYRGSLDAASGAEWAATESL